MVWIIRGVLDGSREQFRSSGVHSMFVIIAVPVFRAAFGHTLRPGLLCCAVRDEPRKSDHHLSNVACNLGAHSGQFASCKQAVCIQGNFLHESVLAPSSRRMQLCNVCVSMAVSHSQWSGQLFLLAPIARTLPSVQIPDQ
eukprot:8839813-Pyramimonas_sp.AAC.1